MVRKWSSALRRASATAVSAMAGVSDASDSPASTRPRSQPRSAKRKIPAATAARLTRTVAAIRPRTPDVSAQSLGSRYTRASLEPIPDLGKSEMSNPGDRRLPPEPGPGRPGAVATHLSPERLPKHRMERAARLDLPETLPDQVMRQIFILVHRVSS